MSYSIYMLTNTIAYVNYSIEDRLIYYAKYMCPNYTFSGMELTAKNLQCSRRADESKEDTERRGGLCVLRMTELWR